MLYQHAAEERMSVLADRMDALSGGAFDGASGTRMARTEGRALTEEAGGEVGNAY